MDLKLLGWNDFFEKNFIPYQQKGLKQGKVILQNKDHYLIMNEIGKPTLARLTGKFLYHVQTNKEFPAVGDWVAFETKENVNYLVIHACLPRENAYVRKLPISGGRKLKNGMIDGGKTEEQVIASNINTAFIVIALDNNFGLRRIERFLTLVYNSRIKPVIILNKVDICNSLDLHIRQVEEIADGVPIHYISAEKNINMNVFNNYCKPGKTVIFLGSSGVGKSTITNYLLGYDKQLKQPTSKASGKGKHTTTSVELIFHDSGGMIIDTPGVKELQLWGEEEILDQSFEDIKSFSAQCKFNDCNHENEPGCAVQKAIEDNLLRQERVYSYKKQLVELQRLQVKKKEFNKKRNKKK